MVFSADHANAIRPETEGPKHSERIDSKSLHTASNDRLAGGSTAGHETEGNFRDQYLQHLGDASKGHQSAFERFGMNHEGGQQTAFHGVSPEVLAKMQSIVPGLTVGSIGEKDKALGDAALASTVGKDGVLAKGGKPGAAKGPSAEQEAVHEASDGFAQLAGDPRGTWEEKPADTAKKDNAHSLLPAMTLLTKADQNINVGGMGETLSSEQLAGQSQDVLHHRAA